jgi:hypothetical protein
MLSVMILQCDSSQPSNIGEKTVDNHFLLILELLMLKITVLREMVQPMILRQLRLPLNPILVGMGNKKQSIFPTAPI